MEVEHEQSLLSRAAGGDEDAFAELYDLLAGQAYSLALYVVKDPRAAQDVVQDAFVNIWRMARSYQSDKGTVRAWAMTAIRNRAVDHLRREHARPQATVDIGTIDLPGPKDATWDEVARSIDASVVQTALASLPAEQREPLEMAYFQGMSQQEIAMAAGLPLGTVKSRMRLGLRKLRERLTRGDRSAVR